MDNQVFVLQSEADLSSVAKSIISLSSGKRVFALLGEMGAGKTTFIKEMVKQLGVEETVSSPTFSIINEYLTSKEGEKIFHADLYRLEDELEAEEIGFEEYLNGENYIFIEWPQIIEHWLPENTVTLQFEIIDHNRRKIVIL